MVRRIFDITAAAVGLILLTPVLSVAAAGIRLSSPGPVLYRAQRIGRSGIPFTMLKLRTMHCRTVGGSSITAAGDSRVFSFGRILRALKIDELPQLLNVLRGDMAIVGPRPEAADIVERYYTEEFCRTLAVRPGLTSPGSICYYECGEQLLTEGDAEEYYVTHLLPAKMALDLQYLRHATLRSDLVIIFRTIVVLSRRLLQKPQRCSAADSRFPEQTPEPSTRSASRAA